MAPVYKPYQPVNTPVTEQTNYVTPTWRDFFDVIVRFINSLGGVGPAPGNAEYVVGAANATLTAERVATDTATIDVDMATPGQAKWHVFDDSITFAKMQEIPASTLIGRGSAGGTGNPESITLGLGLSMSGTVLSSSGSGWIPLVDGAEPPGFITDGAGVLMLVPGP